MKIINFEESREVKLYTILNAKMDTVYNNNLHVKEYVYNNNEVYLIVNIEKSGQVEYWEIQSIFHDIPLGWIKAENHIKMLNTVVQKVLVNSFSNDNDLNKFNALNGEFSKSKFYNKKFMTVHNGEIYFGLFSEKHFIGFVRISELNFGQIELIQFNFKNVVSVIYDQPNLKYSNPFNNLKKTFLASSYFKTENETVLGFTFGDNNFWVPIEDVNVKETEITAIQNYDVEKLREEYYLNCVRADDAEYYSVNTLFDTTSKLENIINNFKDQKANSTLYNKFKVNIGIICDEFMYYSLKDSANIDYIPYSEEIKPNKKYDLVLVVSSWRGIDGSWQYLANPSGKKRKVLNDLLDDYNAIGIPTIFYSKEDPVNYERFISIANHCEYIYTSAEEIINRYKEDTGNDKVYYLEFSINPKYHNPIGKSFSDDYIQKQVIFAGSWMKKYPVRNNESARIFDGVIHSGNELNIVDRNFDRLLYDYQFPHRYAPYISKTIAHEDLMKLHKATTWGINLNSVKYSNTMFANRVYELQAIGNLIVSNYSMGVNNKFPHIYMAHNKEDVTQIINSTSKSEKLELIAKGISDVMLNHTAYHRINKILENLGHATNLRKPSILVIGKDRETKQSFNQQLYENKEFILEDEMTEDSSVLKNYDFVASFNNDYIYEENYLSNLLSGFAYTDVNVIEMDEINVYNYKEDMKFDKYKSLSKASNVSNVNKVFNIPITELAKPEMHYQENDKKLSVIIPIHNNGRYLEDKCFRSLTRSSIFNKMEIIMIDDGSTDEETLKVINRLRRRNPEIKYYRFEKGSGSASRPRNQGIKMTTTKYLTFLDPDNEASGDGYKLLLDELEKNEELDLTLGNVIKEDNSKRSLLNYYYYVLTNNEGEDIVSNTKNFWVFGF